MKTAKIEIGFYPYLIEIKNELRKWIADCDLEIVLTNTTKIERFEGDSPEHPPSLIKVDDIKVSYKLSVYQYEEGENVYEMPSIPHFIINRPGDLLNAFFMIKKFLNGRWLELTDKEKEELKKYERPEIKAYKILLGNADNQ